MPDRESREIIGRIIDRTATEDDRRRLDHLSWLKAKSLKRPKPRRIKHWLGPWFGSPKPTGGKG